MTKKAPGLVIVRENPRWIMSHIKTHTDANHGKVLGPVDRRYRDETGEKLHRLLRSQIAARRETGTEFGPFLVKDWMK